MAAREKRYWARRPMGYSGADFDRGQVLALAGATNDEKLIRLGYVTEVERNATTYTCSHCQGEFIGIAERTAHGDYRHPSRERSAQEQEALEDRLETRLEREAPLYLENAAGAR